MNKRIAIQLYGHLRCWQEVYTSIFDHIILANPHVHFDIFMHVWDEIDAKQNAVHYKKDMHFAGIKLSDNEIGNVKNAYRPAAILIEPQVQLNDDDITFITENNYDLERGLILKNMAHTFCSVNKLRKQYEDENNFTYDLVITSRPDIEFLRPLHLKDFYERNGGWEHFTSLDKNFFTTYINGVSSVISQKNYLAGIDLLLIASSPAMNLLSKWEDEIKDVYKFGWAELSLTYFANKYNLIHNYIYYEKDKNWSIKRVGSREKGFLQSVSNALYRRLLPLLMKSNLFCQDIYLNRTKYNNHKQYLKEYLNHKGGRR